LEEPPPQTHKTLCETAIIF